MSNQNQQKSDRYIKVQFPCGEVGIVRLEDIRDGSISSYADYLDTLIMHEGAQLTKSNLRASILTSLETYKETELLSFCSQASTIVFPVFIEDDDESIYLPDLAEWLDCPESYLFVNEEMWATQTNILEILSNVPVTYLINYANDNGFVGMESLLVAFTDTDHGTISTIFGIDGQTYLAFDIVPC